MNEFLDAFKPDAPLDEPTTPTATKGPAISVTHAVTDRTALPELPPEVVHGIIRRGGKLLIAGASKSGKSYLLIELAVAIVTGLYWLGMHCTRGRVLYVNLEIQAPQFMHRVCNVCEAMDADTTAVADGLDIANLRGKFSDIGELADALLESFPRGTYDVVIIDPAYKVQSGKENDADSVTWFCSQLDRIAEGMGCTVVYTHHHSKGAQGGKAAEDRASGSGVFARDADALIDMVALEDSDEVREARGILGWNEAAAYRLEFVLRDFASPAPMNIWFKWPVHRVDPSGMLDGAEPKRVGGSRAWHREQSRHELNRMERDLDEFMGDRDEVSRHEFVAWLGKDARTVNKYIGRSGRFKLDAGQNNATIKRLDPTE